MLIIFSGLPGAGKSTIARALAGEVGAVWLRIDSIEVAIANARLEAEVADAGYRAACAVAADNLGLGLDVVADSVNPLTVTREAWRQVAVAAGTAFVEVEVVCSDAAEHRRRVEGRVSDVPGLTKPTWREVVERDYQPWSGDRVLLDTALQDLQACVARLRAEIAARR